MKLFSTILLAVGVATTSYAFEGHLDDIDSLASKEDPSLFWWSPIGKFEKYLSINERCCGESLDECKCPVRQWRWKWIKNKWEKSCDTTIPQKSSIYAYTKADDDFSSLAGALEQTGLDDTLVSPGDAGFTVFAPTDAAFDALEAIPPTEQLTSILLYHVVGGVVTSDQLTDGQVVPTVNGESITINLTDAGPTITTANGSTVNILATDRLASNGVIHTIDGVLIP